jgi:hypothetical protein
MEVAQALEKLDAWIEQEEFRGWDPHDALNSPLLRRIAGQNCLIGIVLVQCLRRSPVNLRPLLKVHKGYNPKAMGLFLASSAQKFISTREEVHLKRVRFVGDWLAMNASQKYAGPCWGYNFDWPNRGFFVPAGTPTIVNTAFIALSFLDAESVLASSAGVSERAGEEGLQTARNDGSKLSSNALSIARCACEFILCNLNALRPSSREICFSYTPLDRRFVHNANLLGAWLLAAVYSRTGENKLAESAIAAARFTVSRQRPDGSWPYGIARSDQWVDNFHTGYVLMSLRRIGRYLQTDEFEAASCSGYEYWKQRMFLASLIPKYYPDRVFPVDIHCVSQAILTFMEFRDIDPSAMNRAEGLCRWAIENLQDPKGFFHYQIRRWYRVRIPYLRWAQAWMQFALTRFIYGSRTVTRSEIPFAARS